MEQQPETYFKWCEGVPTPTATEMTSEITTEWVSLLEKTFETDMIGLVAGEDVRVISDGQTSLATSLLDWTMSSRQRLCGMLGPSAFKSTEGGVLVLHFANQQRYYQYASAFYPEGEFGGSVGMQLRTGYPHIVLWGTEGYQLGPTIAHELLHLAMAHRSLPIWLEEGMAQMFELDMGSFDAIAYQSEELQQCKAFGTSRTWKYSGVAKSFLEVKTLKNLLTSWRKLLSEIYLQNTAKTHG